MNEIKLDQASCFKMRIGILILVLLLAGCGSYPFGPDTVVTADSGSCVVLLHGIRRSKDSMLRIEDALKDANYIVWNEGYPSTKAPIQKLAATYVAKGVEFCRNQGASKIHFVTHSLGGILVRQYLQANAVPAGSRAVMLSPPNKGSVLVDKLKKYSLYRRVMGPAGEQLGTDAASVLDRLAPIAIEVGVIAGKSGLAPWFSPYIPGKDDGMVSIEQTKLPEMRDFIVIKSSHWFIMQNAQAVAQALYFLKYGKFKR